MTSAGTPVFMIGLDAAEWSLIRSWCGEGVLPNLAGLMAAGSWGELGSVADAYAGGVWPTFYTGKDVPWHGIYHNKQWRQANMRCEVPNTAWLPERPFWEHQNLSDARICAVDVPMTVGAPASVHGIQLAGWGTHDLITRGAWPTSLWTQLRRRHGKPVMEAERFGPQTPASLERLHRMLLASTEQMAGVAEDLLDRGPWDLFIAVLGATHRGGHYLWDLSQIDADALPPDRRRQLEAALKDIYIASDRAIGRILDRLPAQARVLVFAVHGMAKNRGWSDLCPELLARFWQAEPGGEANKGLLYRLKSALPLQLTEQILSFVPLSLRQELVKIWSARMFDWSATQAFPLPMDSAGYLRINAEGREPRGIVSGQDAYRRVCAEIEEGLRGWRVRRTGEPIVKQVIRAYADCPADAPQRALLPDLVVTWADVSAIDGDGATSPAFGDLGLSDQGRLPSGRAGNHTNRGWFIAGGPGIPAGERPGAHIVDLVPTALTWLGQSPYAGLQGRSIFQQRCDPSVPTVTPGSASRRQRPARRSIANRS